MDRTAEFRTALGSRVRELRKQRGMSQDVLEERAALERPWVSRLENGRHSLDDFDKLSRLAAGLGLTLSELLWPVLLPGDAAELEATARRQFEQERRAFNEALRRKYFSALTDPAATQILNAVAQLVAEGRPEIVEFVAGMIGRGAQLAMAEQVLSAVERLPDS